MRPIPIRLVAAIALALVFLPGLFLRDRGQRWDHRRQLAISPLAVPEDLAARLGPFRLQGAWQLSSRDDLFGG